MLMLLTAIVVSALLFFTVTHLLGSPAEMMLGQDASPQAIAALNAAYGFDQPPLTVSAPLMAPALLPLMAEMRSRSVATSWRSLSSTPQVKAPCDPPP